MFGKCRGCEAKDGEIKHLLGQLERVNEMLERAQNRIIETAAPGAAARVAFAERKPDEPPKVRPPRPDVFPGIPVVIEAPEEAYEVDES